MTVVTGVNLTKLGTARAAVRAAAHADFECSYVCTDTNTVLRYSRECDLAVMCSMADPFNI